MKIVQEMYARGFSFTEVDLYKAQAHRFQVVDGKLMPALDSIEDWEIKRLMRWCLRRETVSFCRKMISDSGRRSVRV